jgi:hypothetical protein
MAFIVIGAMPQPEQAPPIATVTSPAASSTSSISKWPPCSWICGTLLFR